MVWLFVAIYSLIPIVLLFGDLFLNQDIHRTRKQVICWFEQHHPELDEMEVVPSLGTFYSWSTPFGVLRKLDGIYDDDSIYVVRGSRVIAVDFAASAIGLFSRRKLREIVDASITCFKVLQMLKK